MRVLVTGASRGIGRAICLRLADEADSNGDGPLRIAACGSAHPEELDELVAELGDRGADAIGLLGDLAEAHVPGHLVADAVEAFGGLDALVSNAGLSIQSKLTSQQMVEWDLMFNVNTRATWLLAQAAHPALKESQGCFVTVGSHAGTQPQVGIGCYSATKAAAIMLTRLMAQEWAADGIRANCVSPGLVLTSLTAAAYADPDFKARRAAMVPTGRIADPLVDMAGVVTFLLSPAAGYINGADIVVDGGLADSLLCHLPPKPQSANPPRE